MRCVAFQVIVTHGLICSLAHTAVVAKVLPVKMGVSLLVIERYARMIGFMFALTLKYLK